MQHKNPGYVPWALCFFFLLNYHFKYEGLDSLLDTQPND